MSLVPRATQSLEAARELLCAESCLNARQRIRALAYVIRASSMCRVTPRRDLERGSPIGFLESPSRDQRATIECANPAAHAWAAGRLGNVRRVARRPERRAPFSIPRRVVKVPVRCIVFSEDRPMQLHACLRSIERFAPYDGRVAVLFKASTPEFSRATPSSRTRRRASRSRSRRTSSGTWSG